MQQTTSDWALRIEADNVDCIHLYIHPENKSCEVCQQSAMLLKDILPEVSLSEVSFPEMEKSIIHAYISPEEIEKYGDLSDLVIRIGSRYVKLRMSIINTDLFIKREGIMNSSLGQILETEVNNTTYIHLYLHPTRGYWEAYQQSAILLKELIPQVTLSRVYPRIYPGALSYVAVSLEQIDQIGLLECTELMGEGYLKIYVECLSHASVLMNSVCRK